MYLLTVHIGGAHITAGFFDTTAKQPIYTSYCKVPIYHRLPQNQIFELWNCAIMHAIKVSHAEISGIVITVPTRFDPSAQTLTKDSLSLYPYIVYLDIAKYFSSLLEISYTQVKVYGTATALLKGEMTKTSSVCSAIGITVGTDFNAAKWDGDRFTTLISDHCMHNEKIDFRLSTRSLMNEYAQKTGLSILNVKQIIEIYQDNITARQLINDYKQRLLDYLSLNVSGSDIKEVIIEGDIVYAWRWIYPALFKKLSPVVVRPAKADKRTIFLGAALLYMDNQYGISASNYDT